MRKTLRIKRSKHAKRRSTRRHRGGRGYTTGAAAELKQMAPASLMGGFLKKLFK